MTFIDLFSDQAALYANARPRYPKELFARVAELSPGRGWAWDCGTGNGQAAVALAEYFGAVFASDPSEAQIANAIAARNVHYSVQAAERTDFADHVFDAVCVAQALHWFDFDAFFGEVRRVAKPGALFCAWGYDTMRVQPDFDAVFRAEVLDVVAPCWAPQNQILWRGYADVPMPFAPIEMPPMQIESRWNFRQFMAYVRTWSAVRRCEADLGRAFLESAERQLALHWGDTEGERSVVMPLHTLAGRIA